MTQPSSIPEDIKAEQSTLGAMLIEPEAIDKAAAILVASDFSRESHRMLFDAFTALAGRGEPVDLITAEAELKARHQFDLVGGRNALVVLYDVVPTAANVEYYARIVAEKAALRRLMATGDQLLSAAQAGDGDAASLLKRAELSLQRIADRAKPKEASFRRDPLAVRMVDMADIGPPPTELPLLWWVLTQKMTHWLSAPSGAGKTTLAFNILTAMAEGTDLWGKETPRPVRSVYVDLESGAVIQQTKLQKLYEGTPRVRDRLLFLNDIQLPAELPDLVSFCQSRSVDLVVFDTAAKTWNLRDENDNAEIGRSVTPVLETLKRAGIATLVIDHTGKNGIGPRGASAKPANVDVVLGVEVRGEGESAVVQINCPKHKLLGFPPPLVLKRVGRDRFERVNAESAGPAEETCSKQVQCQQLIKDALEASEVPLTHGALLKMAGEADFSKSTFNLVWKSMKQEKAIVADGDGYTWDPYAD